jgi:hypothetical protein
LFNPLSIAQCLKDMVARKTFVESDVAVDVTREEPLYFSYQLSTKYSSASAEELLSNINDSVVAASHHLAESTVLFITLGSAKCYFLVQQQDGNNDNEIDSRIKQNRNNNSKTNNESKRVEKQVKYNKNIDDKDVNDKTQQDTSNKRTHDNTDNEINGMRQQDEHYKNNDNNDNKSNTNSISNNKMLGVVANCHRQPSSSFTSRCIDVAEVVDALSKAVADVLHYNEDIRVVLTVSPVRHSRDGLVENSRSKATLICAAHALADKFPASVSYFPSYEYMLDELRDYRYFCAPSKRIWLPIAAFGSNFQS